jgi:site-specific DNA recombinase
MCQDLRVRRIDAVVALDQDRLVREPHELELLLRLCKEVNAQHIVTSEGDIAASSITNARIRVQAAAQEIKTMSVRHKRMQEDIAKAGRWGGGFRGFGYSADHLTLNEGEADLLRDAARRIIAGESAGAIAREWNAVGVRTVLGKKWNGLAIRRILKSPAITGLRQHHGRVVAVAVWPAIIDRVTWEAVRRAIASRPEAKVGPPPRDYLLTGGLAICGLCGAALRARPRADKVRSYVCVAEERRDGFRPCGGVRCVAKPLEDLIFEELLAAMDEAGLERAMQFDMADEVAHQSELLAVLADTEHKLAQIEERYLEGDVSRASYGRIRDRHRRIADDVRQRLAARKARQLSEETPRAAGELRTWWADAALTQRRAFLRVLIKSVLVKPAAYRGARFSSSRIEIVWLRTTS